MKHIKELISELIEELDYQNEEKVHRADEKDGGTLYGRERKNE